MNRRATTGTFARRLAVRLVALCLLAGGGPAVASAVPGAPAQARKPCVVLLHGLGRTFLSMEPLARALRRAGYVTANIDYPSRHDTIEALAADAVPRGLDACRQAQAAPIHLVTHSMGGILTRQYLAGHDVPELGRVVMLGPPNQGSAVADKLRDQPIYRRVNGPAGQQLGTGPDGIAARLGPVDFPLGVLAGREVTAVDEFVSAGIAGEGDGKVLVEEARVAGMADFRVLDADHTFIVSDPVAIAEVIAFLADGRFSHRETADGTDADAGRAR